MRRTPPPSFPEKLKRTPPAVRKTDSEEEGAPAPAAEKSTDSEITFKPSQDPTSPPETSTPALTPGEAIRAKAAQLKQTLASQYTRGSQKTAQESPAQPGAPQSGALHPGSAQLGKTAQTEFRPDGRPEKSAAPTQPTQKPTAEQGEGVRAAKQQQTEHVEEVKPTPPPFKSAEECVIEFFDRTALTDMGQLQRDGPGGYSISVEDVTSILERSERRPPYSQNDVMEAFEYVRKSLQKIVTVEEDRDSKFARLRELWTQLKTAVLLQPTPENIAGVADAYAETKPLMEAILRLQVSTLIPYVNEKLPTSQAKGAVEAWLTDVRFKEDRQATEIAVSRYMLSASAEIADAAKRRSQDVHQERLSDPTHLWYDEVEAEEAERQRKVVSPTPPPEREADQDALERRIVDRLQRDFEQRLELVSKEAENKALKEALSISGKVAPAPQADIRIRKDLEKFKGNVDGVEFLKWIYRYELYQDKTRPAEQRQIDLLLHMVAGSEPYQIVDAIPVTKTGYEQALAALHARYGNKEEYATRLRDEALDLECPTSESKVSLMTFGIKARHVVEALARMDKPLDATQTLKPWMERFPAETQKAYAAFAVKDQSVKTDFETFWSFLKDRTEYNFSKSFRILMSA